MALIHCKLWSNDLSNRYECPTVCWVTRPILAVDITCNKINIDLQEQYNEEENVVIIMRIN